MDGTTRVTARSRNIPILAPMLPPEPSVDQQPRPKVDTRAVVAVVLGAVSLAGLIFPPMLLVGITATVLGWRSRKSVASSGGALSGWTAAWIAVGLGILGSLLSLVIPGLIVYVWIYAAFHGGQLPPGPAITPAPFPPAAP